MSGGVQTGVVIGRPNHVGICLQYLVAKRKHVIFHLAHVVLDAAEAGNAAVDCLAAQGYQFMVTAAFLQHGANQFVGAGGFILPRASRNSKYFHIDHSLSSNARMAFPSQSALFLSNLSKPSQDASRASADGGPLPARCLPSPDHEDAERLPSNGHERANRSPPAIQIPPNPPLRKGGREDFHGNFYLPPIIG